MLLCVQYASVGPQRVQGEHVQRASSKFPERVFMAFSEYALSFFKLQSLESSIQLFYMLLIVLHYLITYFMLLGIF